MVAWTATIPLFWGIFGKAGKMGHLGTRFTRAGEFIYEWAWVLTLVTYAGLSGVILVYFWDFWPTLF